MRTVTQRRSELAQNKPHRPLRIVVLDDDPTGMQTVHGCLVVTRWDEETIRLAFNDEIPFFFVLTNTRAYDPEQAGKRVYTIASVVLRVARERNEHVLFVSRGDSTLRGHFPLELDAIETASRDAGVEHCEVRLFVPAFIEGGRLTRNGTHYVVNDKTWVPASETEFARDQVFGYRSSDLRSYIEEKTAGAVAAEDVYVASRDIMGSGNGSTLFDVKRATCGPRYVVADAEGYHDLDVLTTVVENAIARGVRIQIQSAASFVKTLTHCSSIPLVKPENSGTNGIVIVGSHVQKATTQLTHLLTQERVRGIEIDVKQLLAHPDGAATLLSDLVTCVYRGWRRHETPVVYTSRHELVYSDHKARLDAGRKISGFLVRLLQALGDFPEYVIAKGGITSHDLLVHGAGVSRVRVLGQIHPGVPIVRIPEEYKLAGVPFVIFPGNVGDESALTTVWRRCSAP